VTDEPQVRRVSRRGLLAMCDRLDGRPGRATYVGGECLFEAPMEAVRVIPPFPLAHQAAYEERVETGPLRDLLLAPRTVALVAVRLGGYGAAVYRDEEPIAIRNGTRFVKNRNRKGGSSSGRFARRRGEQARDLHDRAAELVAEVIGPHAAHVDHLILAGDRLALQAVTERSRLLQSLLSLQIPLAIDVPGDPRRATFEGLAREVWSSEVMRIAGPPDPV